MPLLDYLLSVEPLKPLNIDSFMADPPKNRISKIGIEFEGGWTKLPEGCRGDKDTSVKVKSTIDVPLTHIGEVHSFPMQPAQYATWMKKYYPTKVDASCGLHVHMSFQTESGAQAIRLYNILTEPEYQDTMYEYLVHWAKGEGIPASHHIWSRLSGNIEYCKREFWPDLQIRATNKDYDHFRNGNRYTGINYCVGRHGTIECRLLPMFEDVNQSIRAVKRVLDITNACLILLGKKKEEKYKSVINLPEDTYVEGVKVII